MRVIVCLLLAAYGVRALPFIAAREEYKGMCNVHLVIYGGVVPPVVATSFCIPEPFGAVTRTFGLCGRDGLCREVVAWGSFNAPILAVTRPRRVLESWPSFKAPCRGHLTMSRRRVARSGGEPGVLGWCQCIK